MICALFIPEAWFGDTATMEPIILSRIPADRYNKVSKLVFLCMLIIISVKIPICVKMRWCYLVDGNLHFCKT